MIKFSGISEKGKSKVSEQQIEMSAAVEFLKPFFIVRTSGEETSDYFWVHKKSTWKDIKVGMYYFKVYLFLGSFQR